MPIYEYRCQNGHQFEAFQAMSEDPVSTCQVCGAPVERVFHPVAVHFKGSGFYTTDYARKAPAKSDDGKEPSKKDAAAGKDKGGKDKGGKEKAASSSSKDGD